MILDLSALKSAIAALDKSMGYLNSDLAKDPNLREQFRAAAIQAFEFTHEVAFKMLKRWLESAVPDSSAIDQMNYMEIIRAGAEAGFIMDIARFRDYREKRNITSHTYNNEKAELIAASLGEFSEDISFLLEELERRNLGKD
ncbi:MAG: nucleotidyltransferase substrate binding protein [Nitrospinae bacterium]|nr:nucleotidyltransferase substrate binding protein [Nitrospinota bacterium]